MMAWPLRRGSYSGSSSSSERAYSSAYSGAIVEYLIKKYGNGRFTVPDDQTEKQLDDRYFAHFAEGASEDLLVTSISSLPWLQALSCHRW
jgi:hypothetical protein